jgi:ABC-type dipeptide/oligopeptide/nickel transport system ATPase component
MIEHLPSEASRPEPHGADFALTVEGLTCQFKLRGEDRTAISNVSFRVRLGEFVGIVGETGSGKSMTLRSILRLLPPNARIISGSVRLGDRDLLAVPPREFRQIRGARIGFIPQQPQSALNPILRLDRQFRNVLRAHAKAGSGEARDRAIEALRRVQIHNPERVLASYAHEISGGMAQRVVLAMVLQMEPTLLLADEPTTALDVTVQREVLDLISSLYRKANRSVVLVTHDLGVVAQYCDTMVVLRGGEVVESGPVAEVFAHPAASYTRLLVDAAGPGRLS